MKRIYLEITNSCNLNCKFCTNDKGTNFLSLDSFEKYIPQIKEYTDYIYLHVLGEPLLHKDLDKMLDILDKENMNLQLVTNGVLLDKHLDILNHKCLRKLSISIHSINNSSIDDKYFKTIDYIIENNNNKYIELRFYDYDKLDKRIKEYLNRLKDLYGLKETSKNNSYKLKDNVYIFTTDLFKWPNINDEYIEDKGTCHGLKDQLAILSNGDVVSCCLDTQGINKFDNLNEKSLLDILNSDLYINSLNDLNNNKLSLPLCQHCTYHHRFDKHN